MYPLFLNERVSDILINVIHHWFNRPAKIGKDVALLAQGLLTESAKRHYRQLKETDL